MHAHIRRTLAEKFGAAADATPILYGGSCKPLQRPRTLRQNPMWDGKVSSASAPRSGFVHPNRPIV